MTTIFQAPTIEQLATQMQAALQDPISQVADFPALIRFKDGTLHPPLFLVLAFDDDAELYLNLANHYQDGRPIYGLQLYGPDNTRILRTRISDMAAFLIEQMQRVQPQGPYLIGGQCAGGIIAFEMAQQLQAQGHPVALLALIDAADAKAKLKPNQTRNNPAQPLPKPARTTAVELESQPTAQLAGAASPVAQQQSWQQRLHQVLQKLTQILKEKLGSRIKVRLLEYHLDRGLPLPSYLETLSSYATYAFAVKRYTPQGRFEGNVALLRATQGDGRSTDVPFLNLYEDPLFGWGVRVTRPIQVFDVPGGHGSMLDQRNAAGSARVLQQVVQEALWEEEAGLASRLDKK